jgi:hypothetical protein
MHYLQPPTDVGNYYLLVVMYLHLLRFNTSKCMRRKELEVVFINEMECGRLIFIREKSEMTHGTL